MGRSNGLRIAVQTDEECLRTSPQQCLGMAAEPNSAIDDYRPSCWLGLSLQRGRQQRNDLRQHHRKMTGKCIHPSHLARAQSSAVVKTEPASENAAAEILSRASSRIRRTPWPCSPTSSGRAATSSGRMPGGGLGPPRAISTHSFLYSPFAAGPGVTRVPRFQPEIRGESYLAPGKLRQGVRTCGLKPQDTSRRTFLLVSFRSTDRRNRLVQFGEGGFLLCRVVQPGLRIPDLHPVESADDDTFLVQARVHPQVRRNRDTALLIWSVVRGARREHALVVADRLA